MEFKQFGKYTILKKIGAGGMAEILLASTPGPTGISRFIVIKKVLSQYATNQEFRTMFKNEGRVVCNLKHRNIVPVYEFGIEDNLLFLAMEYISGKNLRELIKKLKSFKKSIDIFHAVYIIKEITSGLNYAHNAIDSNTGQPLNLIHRDVSPQNVMLSFDGEIKLIDFGISKISGTELTRAGHLKGKFSYMSPEQARGEIIDGRTDIFCLGIILWELLSGKKLFSSKDEMNALKKIRTCDIPDIQKINPKIPSELAKIVNQSLKKNKNLRYQTAAQFEKDLSLFLNKNYPNFSQYDFMSFVKEVYAKDIIEERKVLKNFAQKFKKYIKSINNHDQELIPEKNNMLELPDIDSQLEIEKNKDSAVTLTQKKEGIKEQTYVNTSIIEDSRTIKKSNLNMLKGKNYDTEISDHTIKRKKSDESFVTKNSDFDIMKDTEDNLSKFSTSNKSQFTTSGFRPSKINSFSAQKRQSQRETIEKKLKFIKNVTALSLTLLVGYSIFHVFKNKEALIDSRIVKKVYKKTQLETEKNKIKEQIQNEQNRKISNVVSVKKILIKTQPSGAGIYANNKLITYTPAILKIQPDQPITLVIQKYGYHAYSIQRELGSELSSTLSVQLQKKNRKKRQEW